MGPLRWGCGGGIRIVDGPQKRARTPMDKGDISTGCGVQKRVNPKGRERKPKARVCRAEREGGGERAQGREGGGGERTRERERERGEGEGRGGG